MKKLLLFCAFLSLFSCHRNANKSEAVYTDDYSATESVVLKEEVATVNEAAALEIVSEKRIKEAYLRFESQNLEATTARILHLLKQNNAFVQDDRTSKSSRSISKELVLRVPAANFNRLLDSITIGIPYFDTKTISSKNVTEEFIDLQARLKAKRALEENYIQLLKKAKNVKEMLEVERELATIREDIEAKEGRLRYLKDKVALSTIRLEYYTYTAESGVTVSYFKKMGKAIKSGFNGLSSLFLGLLSIWPFFLFLGIIFVAIRKYITKRNTSKHE